jgi:hypothetical protein
LGYHYNTQKMWVEITAYCYRIEEEEEEEGEEEKGLS